MMRGMFQMPENPKTFVVTCKGCHRNVPSGEPLHVVFGRPPRGSYFLWPVNGAKTTPGTTETPSGQTAPPLN